MNSFNLFMPLLVVTLLISSVLLAPLDSKQNNIKSHNTSATETETKIGDASSPKYSKRDDSSVTETPEATSYKNTSTFTCYGKITGYYADVKLGCRVYHFCTQMDSMGETSYQRMSYICLEGSIFDQKDLNCVKESELRVPCHRAEQEYEASNRQFDSREESQPSMSDNLAANIMMNPITRFIAG